MKSTILIVDDDKTNLNLIATILKDNYDIKIASNGKIALDILDKFHIDLILLDINMPEIDGYEVASRIKHIEKLKHIPYMFLTGKADEESIVKGFEYGAVDYLTKPIKIEELKQRVKTQIKISKLQIKLLDKIKLINKKNELILQQEKQAVVSQMLDAVAHQWKQPLSVVMLLLQEIEMDCKYGQLDEKNAEKNIDEMKGQINHLLTTLDVFRSLFKVNNNIKPFIFNDMFNSVLELIKVDLSMDNIHVINNIKDELNIYACESEIKHIFINLIANTRNSYIDNEIEKRDIFIDYEEKEDSYVILFQDYAGGIKKELLNDIFKSNVTGRASKGGTGVGLYISKVIVEKYNGNISVENKNGGACFSIELVKNLNLDPIK